VLFLERFWELLFRFFSLLELHSLSPTGTFRTSHKLQSERSWSLLIFGTRKKNNNSEAPAFHFKNIMTDTELGPQQDHVDEVGGSDERMTWKSRIIGDYDYARLCTPRFDPWKKENQKPLPSYKKDDRLAWLLAALLGFQHSLAVVGGTVIPGILLGNQDPSGQAGRYLVSYALLTSGEYHRPIDRSTAFPSRHHKI